MLVQLLRETVLQYFTFCYQIEKVVLLTFQKISRNATMDFFKKA